MAGQDVVVRVIVGVQASLHAQTHRLVWQSALIARTCVQGYSGAIWQGRLEAKTTLSAVIATFFQDVCLSPEGCSLAYKGTLLSEQVTIRQVCLACAGRSHFVKPACDQTARVPCAIHAITCSSADIGAT